MGSGGVGGYFGALLARAEHRLAIVGRGPHLESIQKEGLTVESAIEPRFTVPAHAHEVPEPGVTPDLVLFTVKSYDAAEAAKVIRPAVGPDTTVLTLLNGIDSGDLLADEFGSERILEGVVYIESYVKAPGVIAQAGGPRRVIFGNRNGNGMREQRLLAAFEAAGWNVDLSTNILSPMWQKLTFIGPFAAFNTVTGLRADQLVSRDECANLIHTMMSEYASVGRAEGAEMADDAADTALERLRGFPGLTSMFRDRVANKRLEAEALVGEVVRRGQTHGIPTPTTDAMYALLTPMVDGGAGDLG
jgi:2-dehydropantoate 2-reductase